MNLLILPDKIIYDARKIVERQLFFTTKGRIHDKIGTLGWDMIDKKGRKFWLVAKRYVYDTPEQGIISIRKQIVEKAYQEGYNLLIYIQEEDRDYIYHVDPKDILKNHWKNEFNGQTMLNFDIRANGINMIPTRTNTKLLEKWMSYAIKR